MNLIMGLKEAGLKCQEFTKCYFSIIHQEIKEVATRDHLINIGH